MAAQLNTGPRGRYHLHQNSSINVTPFVDVMLVLLIIFMVAIPAATTTINLDLPPATEPTAADRPPVVISVQTDGDVFLDGVSTKLAALPSALRRQIDGPNPGAQRVYLRADKTVRYGRLMAVMNTLHQAGFQQVGLINEDLS